MVVPLHHVQNSPCQENSEIDAVPRGLIGAPRSQELQRCNSFGYVGHKVVNELGILWAALGDYFM